MRAILLLIQLSAAMLHFLFHGLLSVEIVFQWTSLTFSNYFISVWKCLVINGALCWYFSFFHLQTISTWSINRLSLMACCTLPILALMLRLLVDLPFPWNHEHGALWDLDSYFMLLTSRKNGLVIAETLLCQQFDAFHPCWHIVVQIPFFSLPFLMCWLR